MWYKLPISIALLLAWLSEVRVGLGLLNAPDDASVVAGILVLLVCLALLLATAHYGIKHLTKQQTKKESL